MSTEHIKYIDTAKGIGIILVLVGHIFPRDFVNSIYLFHMPLFFFLSGFTLSPQKGMGFINKKIKSLLIPYFSFLFLLTSINVIESLILSAPTFKSILKSYLHSLYGGATLRGDFGAYWFVTVLFFSIIFLNWMLVNIKKKYIITTIIFMYVFSYFNSYYAKNFHPPLGINIMLQSVPIMYIGYIASKNTRLFRILSLIGVAFIPFYFLGFSDFMDVDLKQASYGLPVVSSMMSLSLIYLTLFISQKLEHNLTLQIVASSSMTIMFLHQWFHLRMLKLGLENPYIITIITITLSILCHFLIKAKRTPSILFLGKRIG